MDAARPNGRKLSAPKTRMSTTTIKNLRFRLRKSQISDRRGERSTARRTKPPMRWAIASVLSNRHAVGHRAQNTDGLAASTGSRSRFSLMSGNTRIYRDFGSRLVTAVHPRGRHSNHPSETPTQVVKSQLARGTCRTFRDFISMVVPTGFHLTSTLECPNDKQERFLCQ